MRYFLFFLFFILAQYSFSKDYSSFSSNLSHLKRKYRALVQNEKEVAKFENSIDVLESPLADLEKDLKDYISTHKIDNNNELYTLLIEIREFESFISRSTCECLYYFNKFLNEIGAQSYFITQQVDIKVFVAVAGNFKFYYAYSLNNWLQTVTINTRMTNGYEKTLFGLHEEVEIFKITSKDVKTKTFNVMVEVLNKEKKKKYDECEDKFPRL